MFTLDTPKETKKGPIFDLGLCRCCGSMKRCRLLNVEYNHSGQKEIYSDMIMDCFSLMLSHLDGKPGERLVCATCVLQLRQACDFRRQVLTCEEAFVQLKMCSERDRVEEKDQSWMLPDVKVNMNIVKKEADLCMAIDNESMASDRDVLGGSECGEIDKEKLADIKYQVPESDSNDDLPISRLTSTTRPPHADTEPMPKRKRIKLVKVKKKRSKSGEEQKGELNMSKLQQIHREKDTTYLQATNLLTLVEYSYICPFKCRHNNLLCYYCGQHCSDPTELRQHTTQHDPKKFKIIENNKLIKVDLTRIDCRLCSEKIDSLTEFKNHLINRHDKKYYTEYPDSILPFRLLVDTFNCTLCSEKFLYFHALNKHMNIHYNNFVCETCGLGFVDRCRFMMHQLRHEEGDYPCETCGKVFRADYNRDLHIDRVHKKKGRVFCPKCDVMLMSYPQKMKHLIEVHGEQPQSFTCDYCDKVCRTRRMLTIHRRKEHLKDFRYECQYCGQRFFTRFALTNHIPVHTGERNYKCGVCDKTYPRLKTLKDHTRIHTNDRRYRCHVCGQAFIQNCSLKGHLKSQHPEYTL